MFTATIGIHLGSTRTGLVLSAQLKDTAGANVGTAVTAGFVELGGGDYQWTYASFPDGFRGSAVFTAGAVHQATASINPEDFATAITSAEMAQIRYRLGMDGTQTAPATSTGTLPAIKAKTDLIGAVTGAAGAPAQIIIGDALEARQFSYRAITFSLVGLPSTDWLSYVFTVKADADKDADADALLYVRETNPGDAGDGLRILNRGEVPSASNALASLTVTATTPDTTLDLVLKADAMGLPPSPSGKPYKWELARWTTAKGKEVCGGGDFAVLRSVRRSTAA